MDEKLYGYIRVSSAGQNEARQLEAMAEIGIPEDNIYIDKSIHILLKCYTKINIYIVYFIYILYNQYIKLNEIPLWFARQLRNY